MQDIFNQLLQFLQSIQDAVLPTLYWLRARIGIETVTMAVLSAGGMLILLLGLFSTKRVNLLGEAAHLEGVREPGLIDRLQTRLYQSGIRIKVYEFLAVGAMLGAALGGVFILLGFASIGIAFGLSGPVLYYQFLMNRRVKEMRQFREELPIAILDTRDHLIMRANDLRGAMLEMAERGPQSLRVDFDYAFRLMSSGADSEPLALREVSRKREEPFFRQFFDTLANHHKGGDTAAVLTRVAQGQKTHNRLQAKTRAKQSGLRLVGIIYLLAPPCFAVFMALMGGPESIAFYASLEGQLVQLLAVASGVLSYWLSGKIAMRGLYMDEVTRVRLDTEQVAAFVTSDEFGGSLESEPVLAGTDFNGHAASNGVLTNAAMAAPATVAAAALNGNGLHASAGGGLDEFDLEPEGDDVEDADDLDEVESLLAFQNLDVDALFRAPDAIEAVPEFTSVAEDARTSGDLDEIGESDEDDVEVNGEDSSEDDVEGEREDKANGRASASADGAGVTRTESDEPSRWARPAPPPTPPVAPEPDQTRAAPRVDTANATSEEMPAPPTDAANAPLYGRKRRGQQGEPKS